MIREEANELVRDKIAENPSIPMNLIYALFRDKIQAQSHNFIPSSVRECNK